MLLTIISLMVFAKQGKNMVKGLYGDNGRSRVFHPLVYIHISRITIFPVHGLRASSFVPGPSKRMNEMNATVRLCSGFSLQPEMELQQFALL